MSTWIGNPGDRLSLRECQRALADCARLAARPSWIWLGGFLYPSLLLVPAIGLRSIRDEWGGDWLVLLIGALSNATFLPLIKLVAGLARLAAPRSWDECLAKRGRVRLRDAWAAGRGLAWAALGLWLCVLLLDLAALGVGLAAYPAPAQEREPIAYLVGGPVLLFCCAYGLVVSVLFQLALHSLAQNRRGVVSALQHAWRLAQHDPWAAVRATVVDCALSFVLGAGLFLADKAFCCLFPFAGLALAILTAIAGVARALYWGRIYRALGGLTPEDGVPGIPPPPPAG